MSSPECFDCEKIGTHKIELVLIEYYCDDHIIGRLKELNDIMRKLQYVCPECRSKQYFSNSTASDEHDVYFSICCMTCKTDYSPSHGLASVNRNFVELNPQMSDAEKAFWLPRDDYKECQHCGKKVKTLYTKNLCDVCYVVVKY